MDNQTQPERIIVIGTSAGGPTALKALVAQLDPALPAAIFVVQHLAPDSPGMLADMLTRAGPLPASFAHDGEPITAGRILIAPPDHHLLVKEGCVRLFHGARENRARPAIDPLFRSAAVAYGTRTIGVLLTGMLDDDTAGMLAVKRCGGITIVQDPDDAAYPEMTTSALRRVAVDYTLPLKEIGPMLNQLASQQPGDGKASVPEDLRLEQAISERAMGNIDVLRQIADGTTYSCPACGGRMWHLGDDEMLRYRCEVGHTYSMGSMLAGQDEAIEGSLWVALRSLEERTRMLEKLADQEAERGRSRNGSDFDDRAAETKEHAGRLRDFLLQWMGTPDALDGAALEREPA